MKQKFENGSKKKLKDQRANEIIQKAKQAFRFYLDTFTLEIITNQNPAFLYWPIRIKILNLANQNPVF